MKQEHGQPRIGFLDFSTLKILFFLSFSWSDPDSKAQQLNTLFLSTSRDVSF